MKDLISRLNWPQVVAFGILVIGAVVALVFVPTDNWRAIVGIVTAVFGGGASAAMGPVLLRDQDPQ